MATLFTATGALRAYMPPASPCYGLPDRNITTNQKKLFRCHLPMCAWRHSNQIISSVFAWKAKQLALQL